MARLLPLLAAMGVAVAEPGATLRGPVDVSGRRAAVGRTLAEPPPSPVLAPIRDLEGVSYYTDPHHAVADPALKQQNAQAFAPLRAFVAHVVALAAGWMVS